MTEHPRIDQVLDEYGRPVPGAQIYVTDTLTLGNAELTIDGNVALAQPVIADEFGFYTYWANDGIYGEDIYFAGKLRYKGLAYVGVPPQIKGDPGANSQAIGLFSAFSTFTIPAGTDIVRTSGYNALGKGAACYQRDPAVNAAYVAANPRTSALSFNGIGYRLSTDQPLNVQMFGAVGDGVANDYAAFTTALAFVRDRQQPQYNYGYGSFRLFVPAGRYLIGANSLDIYGSVRLSGEGTGFGGGSASVLIFTGATTGIRIQASNTSGSSGSGATGFPTGAGTIIEHLGLQGGYAGAESDSHGIHIRAGCTLIDVVVRNFPGDGVYANCALGAGGALEGASNLSRFVRVWTEQCRNGFFLGGADSNASLIDGCSSVSNRQWGYFDNSFLGNFYRGCHTRTNGAGAYHADPSQLNAACTFSDCYSESDQPPSVFAVRTLLVGGFHAAGGAGGAGISVADNKLTLPDTTASATFHVVGAATFDVSATFTQGLGVPGKFSVDTDGNILSFGATGLTLNGAGGAVHIGGAQVVGARQYATAANASDLASVIALANGLKAQLIAHGLIG